MKATTHLPIPKEFPVQPTANDHHATPKTTKDHKTCGHCRLSWDDGKVTSMTPAPSGRCPFESFHVYSEPTEEHDHWSTPNGCHEDCPACKSKARKKPVIESGFDDVEQTETEEEALTNELIAVIWPRLDAGSSKDDITDAVNNVFDAWEPGPG